MAGSASRCVVSEDRTAGSVGGAPWLVVGIDIARWGMKTLCGYREERMLADRATTNGVRPCTPLVRTERKRDVRATRVEAVDTRPAGGGCLLDLYDTYPSVRSACCVGRRRV